MQSEALNGIRFSVDRVSQRIFPHFSVDFDLSDPLELHPLHV